MAGVCVKNMLMIVSKLLPLYGIKYSLPTL